MRVTLSAAAFALALSPVAAQAAEKPILTVYTYDSFVSEWGPGPQIEAAFEAECGCDLRLVAAGDGAALLGRIMLEGAHSEADVALGLDQNLIARAKASGLFAPHGLSPDGVAIPGGWSDPVFLPYDWGYFAFVYDKNRLAHAPDSFEALLNAPEDVTIIIQDPRASTPGLGLLLWVKAVYGDKAADVWARLAPRIVTVSKGWWEGYSAFLEGESAMVLSYTTSPAYHVVAENDESKAAAIFDEGHMMQIEVAGRLAGSDQPELADAFLRFMQSAPFQSVLPTTNWMYPAYESGGAAPTAFPAPLPAERSLTVGADAVDALRESALAEWTDALSR